MFCTFACHGHNNVKWSRCKCQYLKLHCICCREVIDDPWADVYINFIHIPRIMYVQRSKGHWWPFDSFKLKDFRGNIDVMLSCQTVRFCQERAIFGHNSESWHDLDKMVAAHDGSGRRLPLLSMPHLRAIAHRIHHLMQNTAIFLFCWFRWVNGILQPFCCRSHDLTSISSLRVRSSLEMHSQVFSCISFCRCSLCLLIVAKSKVKTQIAIVSSGGGHEHPKRDGWWSAVKLHLFSSLSSLWWWHKYVSPFAMSAACFECKKNVLERTWLQKVIETDVYQLGALLLPGVALGPLF
jgi:hypothetical protein